MICINLFFAFSRSDVVDVMPYDPAHFSALFWITVLAIGG
jgi:hypothetical protein